MVINSVSIVGGIVAVLETADELFRLGTSKCYGRRSLDLGAGAGGRDINNVTAASRISERSNGTT